MAVSSTTHALTVGLRAAVATDEGFLRQLFLEARPELRLLPPPIVDLQIAAQRAQYLRDHPKAVDEIVELDGEPAGRCWTADTDSVLHILDLAVRADQRRQGIGRTALDVIAERAGARGLAVELTVWSANADARRLYRAAGFFEVAESAGYIVMRLEPRNPR